MNGNDEIIIDGGAADECEPAIIAGDGGSMYDRIGGWQGILLFVWICCMAISGLLISYQMGG